MKALLIAITLAAIGEMLFVGNGCTTETKRIEQTVIESEPIGRNQFEIKLRKKTKDE